MIISVKETANKWNISVRRIQFLCEQEESRALRRLEMYI